jgi:prepilin-type N-terminal cleavage/methylation domain-containing protein
MRKHKTNGFTIVELLIVVVVIAILAAITIVSYNGITNRAKATAAQSLVSQIAKKISVYSVDNNGQYPASLAVAGITNTDGLQYTSNGSSFCVTGTTQNVSYFASSTSPSPTAGACNGHGVNGGDTITNLIINPSFESNTNNCSGALGGGAGIFSRAPSDSTIGSNTGRLSWTSAASSEVAIFCYASVESGKAYTARFTAKPSWSGALLRIQFEWSGGGNKWWSPSSSIAATPGQWNVRSATFTAPAGATQVGVQASFISGARPASGDTLEADGFMLVEGNYSVLQYADGNSTGWAWNGTPNNSTSTGPPL